MKTYTLFVLAIFGLAQSVFALNWVSKPSSVQTGQSYTVSATHTFSGGSGLAAGSIYIYKNGAFFAGNGNGGNSFTMAASASTSDAQAGTITYTSTATVTPQGWGSGPMTYNISGTVTVSPSNVPPTASVSVDGRSHGATVTRPYNGSVNVTVRYNASDANGNLSGIRYNVWNQTTGYFDNGGGGFQPASGGSGQYTRTVTLNSSGTWYFWSDAQDSAGSYGSSGDWTNGFRLIVQSAPTVSWHTLPSGPIYTGSWHAARATGSDPDGNLGGVRVQYSVNGGGWQDLAYDASNNGSSFTSNNNGVTVGAPGTHYQFRCLAWDQAGADTGWQYSGGIYVTDRPGSGTFTINGSSGNTSISFGQTVPVVSAVSDPDGNMNVHSFWWDQGNGSSWTHPYRYWSYPANTDGWLNLNLGSNGYDASGGSSTRSFDFRPIRAATYAFHNVVADPTNWVGVGASVIYLTVNKATPAGSFANRSFSTTRTLTAADLNATFANPYSSSVAAPTGAVTYNYPVGSILYPGTYTVSATYSGDTNYTGATVSAAFTVSNTAPSIASLSVSPGTIVFGQTATISATISDTDSNLYTQGLMRYERSVGDYRRPPGIDYSRTGWNGYPVDSYGTWSNANFSNDVASGPSTTKTINYQPGSVPALGYTEFHSNGHDTITWTSNSSWAYLYINKATPSQTGWQNRSWTGTGTAPAETFNVVLSNPYSSSVAAPTGALTFAIVSASGGGAAPTSGSVNSTTQFKPGSYVIRCSYPGDTNYHPATWDVTFTVDNRSPEANFSLTKIAAFRGDVVSINMTVSDPDGNLDYTNLWVHTPLLGSRWIHADSSLATGGVLDRTHSATAYGASGSFVRTFTLPTGQDPEIYTFALAAVDAIGARNDASNRTVETIDWNPPATITYPATLASVLNAATEAPGSISYTYQRGNESHQPANPITVLDAGSYTITATFTPSDAVNYQISTKEIPLTVQRKHVVFEIAPTMFDYVDEDRNGQGDLQGPTITFPDGVDRSMCDITGTEQAGAGGTYTLSVSAKATGNYEGTATVNWTIRCCPALIDFPGATTTSEGQVVLPTRVYTGDPATIAVTTIPSPLSVAWSYRKARPNGGYDNETQGTPADAGVYKIIAHVYDDDPSETGGYAGEAEAYLTIEKAPQAALFLVPQTFTQTYGTAQQLGFSGGYAGNVTYEFTSAVPSSIAVLTGFPENDAAELEAKTGNGSVQVRARRHGGDNYLEAVSEPVTISFARAQQAELKFTPGSQLVFNTTLDLSDLSITSGGSGNGPVSYHILELPNTTPERAILSGGPPATLLTAASGTGSLVVRASKASDDNYESTYADALVVLAKASATVTLSNLEQTYDGTPRPITVTTAPEETLVVNVTYDGSTAAPTNAGSYEVIGAINDFDYEGTTTETLTIARMPVAVILGQLVQTYDGTVKTVSVATLPSGFPTTVTYGSGNRTDVGSYSVDVQIAASEPNHTGSATGTLVIDPAPQTVAISASPSSVAFGQSVTFTATGGHNGYVWGGSAFGSDNPITVTPTAAGKVEVTAYSPEGGNYQTSNTAHAEAIITRVIPVGTFAGKTVNGPYTLSSVDLQAAFAHPNNLVMPPPSGTVTYDHAAGTVLNAGTHTVTASYPGDNNYAPTTAAATFVVNKSTPDIIWNPSPLRYGETYGSGQRGAVAKVGSQTIPGTFTYTPAPGSVATTVGPKELTVHFTPDDTANYHSAAAARTITIGKGLQTITFTNPGNKRYGEFVVLTATSNSALAINYSVSGQAQKVAALSDGSGKALRTTGIGTVTVTASQPGNDYYEAAAPVTHQFQVAKALHTITFPAPSTTGFALLASSSAGIPITYSLTDETGGWVIRDVVPIDPNLPSFKQLAFTGFQTSKTVRVIATGGDEFHETVTATSPMFSSSGGDSFWITRPADTVVAAQGYHFSFYAHHSISQDNSQDLRMYARHSSASDWTWLGDGYFNSHGIVNTGGFIASAGTWEIKIVNGPDANAAEYSDHRLTITAINGQVINFPEPGLRKLNEVFSLGATTTATGLGVTYHVIEGSVEFVTSSSIRVTKPGQVTIEARQAGGSGYAPALSVRRTFTVVSPPKLVIEEPLSYSVATGILSAKGWALDYEDGAPIPVTLVIDGQSFDVAQEQERSDIAAQAAAGNWSVKPVLNCGWKINFPVASLAEGPHSVFIRATDGSEFYVDAGDTNFNGGTPEQREDTITFPEIGPRGFGEEFTLQASAASGRVVTYTVDSGADLISLVDDRVTVGNSAGFVSIRASIPGGNGYPPASVVRTFSIVDGDGDGDGIPDVWERGYGIDASPGSDANNDGVKDVDEYHLWRNPKADGGPPKDSIPVTLTVTAKGTGTGAVILKVGGKNYNFSFPAAGSDWQEPYPFGTDVHTYVKVAAKLGEEAEVGVEWSGAISDFIIKSAKSSVTASELRARVDLSAPGTGTPIQFADAISRSELVDANGGNKIKVRATTEGSLPFGTIDTSKFEVQRRLRFGLGGSRTGDSAGMLVYGVDTYVLGGGLMNFSIVKGPAMTDIREHLSDPKRFQAKVPAGYVDIYRLHDLITIRFYPDGSYPEDGHFKNFSGATPLVAYDLANPMRASGSITQTAGGNSLVMEFQTSYSTTQLRTPRDNGGDYVKQDYVATFKHWGWRTPTAPREGLTVVKTETFQTWVVGSDNNPGGRQNQPIFVRIYRHQGPTIADGVLAQEEHQFGAGDTQLLYGATAVLRGSAADQQLVSHRYAVSPSILLNPPTVEVNSTGGLAQTEYFTSSSQINGGSNFEGLPGFLAGERKTVRRGFLDGGPNDANAVVTHYTYKTHLVDGRAAPATAITTQGATPLGNIDYDYPTAATGQVITKTSVQPAKGATPLHTILRAYSRRLADLDFRNKPIAITRPDSTKTVYSYRVSGEDLVVTELNGKTGGGVTSFADASLAEALDMDANRSIATERTFDKHGRLKREESYVFQGGTTFASLGAVDHAYDSLGNLTAKTHSSGRVLYQAGYTGFRKDWESDDQGIRLDYTYDDYNRVHTMTRAAASDGANTIAATTTTYVYDQAGRLVKETVSAAGTTETLVSSYTYDTANRPKTRTLPGNFKTSITYDSATKTTTTLPGGGTKIEEVHKDGRVKSVTGTAVPDTTTTYAYDTMSGNLKTTQVTAGQTATTEIDWAGRTVSVSTPTYANTVRVVSNAYNTIGQLERQETTVGGAAIAPARVFEYDTYARLKREALKTGTGAIAPATDYDVKEYEFAYQAGAPNHATHIYRYEGVKIWPHAGTNASTSRYASQAYTQVTGLGASTVAHTLSRDFDQNLTESTTTLDRANKKVAVSTTTTGTTATLQQVTLNGLPIKSVNAQGHATLQTYDAFGRVEATDDPRVGPTDHEYHANTTLLKLTTTPDNRTTQYAYDTAGRVKSQTNPDGKLAYFEYDAAGNLTCQWGDTVNPVKYVYNELGQKTEMHTYRSGTWTGATRPSGFDTAGDKTTWSYQATTGLLSSKTDAAGKTTSFQYTDLGQVKKRTDARGWVTDYEYTDPRKLLTNVIYADGVTTDIVYTYDRAGRTTSVTDAAGRRKFDYYDEATVAGTLGASGRLKSEYFDTSSSAPTALVGAHTLTYVYKYGVTGLANGRIGELMLNSSVHVAYGYDSVMRINSIAYAGGNAFTYSYVANSNLIDQVTQGAGGYLRDYDYLSESDRLEKSKHAWGSDTSTQVETAIGADGYNRLGLRTTEKTTGVNYMNTLGRGSERGVHIDYTYTDRMELDDSGKYAVGTGDSLGGLRSGTVRGYEYDQIGNRTADHIGSYTPNALNQYTSIPGVGTLPQDPYDANGNLVKDGVRTYDYDAENRLIKVTEGTSISNYKYDYLGRRIEKSGTGLTTTRFLYDGWNLIAELNSSGTIVRRFAWGLDISGSLQGAGGVGGLLVIDDGVARRYPIYDATHNVIALYTSTGTLAAAYEYDPFGKTSAKLGTYATQNPFRFSTKYTDEETEFVYYGHRYYVPALGRFLNRDPIEEAGGLNLYGFCGNDGVNRWDYLGMNAVWDWLTTKTDPNIPVSTDHEDVFSRIFRTGGTGPNGPYGDTYSRDNLFTFTLYGNSPDKSKVEYYQTHGRGTTDYYLTDIPWEGDPARSRVIRTNHPGGVKAFWGEHTASNSTESKIYIVTDGMPVEASIGDVIKLAISRGGLDVFLNGQSNKLEKAVRNGQMQLGVASFILFHNPTHGGFRDTLESAHGKLMGTTKVGREFAAFLSSTSGFSVNLVVHSQGGITANIAMTQVLHMGGSLQNLSIHYNGAAVNEMVSRALVSSVGATFGGFSINHLDPVPILLGQNIDSPLQAVGAFLMLPSTITGVGSPHSNYLPTSTR